MDALYPVFLIIHSLLRWLVVVFGVLAFVFAVIGRSSLRPWRPVDNRLGMLFTISLDLQVLVGFILYFLLSPLTTAALQNPGAAMGNPATRYFLVEHSFLMLAAVVLAHIGRSFSRKAIDDRTRHQRAALFYGLSLLAILIAIPWPFLPAGRPWIRF